MARILLFSLCFGMLLTGVTAQSGPEPGTTYTYSFADGSELPQIDYQTLRYVSYTSHDSFLVINSNTDEESRQFGYHDASHGGVFFPGNSFVVSVAGDALITFITDTYGSAEGATFEFTDEQGTPLGSIPAVNLGGADGFPSTFAYTGEAGLVTATLTSADFPNAEIYLHGMMSENAAAIEPSNGKTDVWDFAAEQLDTADYNNRLNEDIINDWYDPGITVGSSGNVLPSSWTAGILTWTGGGNDRLRTTNTNLTRYDENISTAPGYSGRIYVNSSGNIGRYMSLSLQEDDEVTLVMKTDAGGEINFQYAADPDVQLDVVPIPSDLTELHFVAGTAGIYRVFDTQGKPSYYRILRSDAVYADLSGTVDTTNANGIPQDFSIVFTNAAGKSWSSTLTDDTYNVQIPRGYTYTLSLEGANGYIITSETTLDVDDTTSTFDITVQKVELYTVSGAVVGLGDNIQKLLLSYVPDPEAHAIFAPMPEIDIENETYWVQLEADIQYTIVAEGVNDFYIPEDTITIAAADTPADITFVPKPVYPVTVTTNGLSAEEAAALVLTFDNLAEDGYSYTFTDINTIALRDGVYSISASGLDLYPVELTLTSNLRVEEAATAKELTFVPVTEWPFDDQLITNGDPAYKGLLFSGNVYNEIQKGHLVLSAGATAQVPVQPGERIVVSYYYTANFSFDGGDPIETNSQSTSIVETASYDYPGAAAGFVTITANAGVTTYITNIRRYTPYPYTSVLTVGTDKDFQTINGALEAIRRMTREAGQGVTVMIDPGNYEEMLVIDAPEITLKNAATQPEIALLNAGVDISASSVRVTSYYGHGYNYYSMGDNQQWNAQILQVNKENGYYSYANKGAGTTNGSWWNATVIVYADDFTAEDIIFENSFNQYISEKEADDIVVIWESGSPGERPAEVWSTAVQDRSYRERAAALAIANNADRVILKKCRVIGRQDSFFGGTNTRVVMYKGAAMGSVDYLFGGMTAVFFKTDLVMNTGGASTDVAYITAAQQSGGRGYLMYECNITSAQPGDESASLTLSKPGYFGRPWQATTSEVVFFNTTIQPTDYTGYEGKSLIEPLGWLNTLGGESNNMYEYGTIELSGEDNSGARAAWATSLSNPTLNDVTEITTFNFTKGDDGWDPLPGLIAADSTTAVRTVYPETAVDVYASGKVIYVTNVQDETVIRVYTINGVLAGAMKIDSDTSFILPEGFWLVNVEAPDGRKTVKAITH